MENKSVSKIIDMTGERCGRLIVLGFHGISKERRAEWDCVCDCGNFVVVQGKYLRNGDTLSCGCYNRDRIAKIGKEHKTHGMTGTRLYNIWSSMRKRCLSETHESYPRYGGRGIKICEEWGSFEKFLKWALENGYSENKSIDRINNDDGYYPENCRWTDMKTQSRNRSSNKRISYKGQTHCIAEWAEILGLETSTLWRRLNVLKMPLEKALQKSDQRKALNH